MVTSPKVDRKVRGTRRFFLTYELQAWCFPWREFFLNALLEALLEPDSHLFDQRILLIHPLIVQIACVSPWCFSLCGVVAAILCYYKRNTKW